MPPAATPGVGARIEKIFFQNQRKLTNWASLAAIERELMVDGLVLRYRTVCRVLVDRLPAGSLQGG
jgi:hypothetical protein